MNEYGLFKKKTEINKCGVRVQNLTDAYRPIN